MALESLIQPLVSLLGMIQTNRQENHRLKDQALADLNAALLATRTYFSEGQLSAARENELSQRWSQAAASCRHFSIPLAEQLQLPNRISVMLQNEYESEYGARLRQRSNQDTDSIFSQPSQQKR